MAGAKNSISVACHSPVMANKITKVQEDAALYFLAFRSMLQLFECIRISTPFHRAHHDSSLFDQLVGERQ
jgi:hypothetical protein